MPSTRAGASYNPSSSLQKGYTCDYGRSQLASEGQGSVNEAQTKKLCHSEADSTLLPSNRADTFTRCLSGHLKSQQEEKLNEFLPYCENISGPSQHLKVTQWMEYIYGKEQHDPFNSRMEEKRPSTTQTSHNSWKKKFQHEKAAKSSYQGQRQGTSHKAIQPGLKNPKDSTRCHGNFVSNSQNHDGTTEQGRSHIKI
ncbi:hypothetical protein O181_085533 [Austropuccinia psidii MF-1]|uniref:Uncharacterized protein n=1 Tax=Austropuccinia psidii MF-1 TaxID=1389203 RepID=A0A9Q3FXP4_9BASI|nr:hypothetical protein [Austropuccinia psidii MF-1]